MKDNIISLKIDATNNINYKNLDVIYSEASKLFETFKKLDKSKAKEEEIFDVLIKLIELVEVNPIYNYNFLKYHQKIREFYRFNPTNNKNEKYTYEYNFSHLKETLKSIHYSELANKSPKSISMNIFELISLYLKDEKKFFEKSNKITYHNFNCPLIESIERLRMFYYRQLFKYPTDPKYKKALKQFDNICKGIKNFKNLINQMKDWIYSIDLDSEQINKKFFIFMIDLEMINSLRNKNSKVIKRV